MRRTNNRSRDRAQTLRQRNRELKLSRSRESVTDQRGPGVETGAVRKSYRRSDKISSEVHQLKVRTSSASQGSNYQGQKSTSILDHRYEENIAPGAFSRSSLSNTQSGELCVVIRKATRKTSFYTTDSVRWIPHREDLPELAAEEESVDPESCENSRQKPRQRRGSLQGVLQDVDPSPIIEDPDDDAQPFITVPVTHENVPLTHTGKLVDPPHEYPPTGFVYAYDPNPAWPKPSYEVPSPDREGTVRHYDAVPGLATPWERNERRSLRREEAYNNPGLVLPVSPDEYVPALENWFRVSGSRIAALLAERKKNESAVELSVAAAYDYTRSIYLNDVPEADDTEAGDAGDENILPYRAKLDFDGCSDDEEQKLDKYFRLPGKTACSSTLAVYYDSSPSSSESGGFAVFNDSPPSSSVALPSAGFQIYESPQSEENAEKSSALVRAAGFHIYDGPTGQENAGLTAFKYSSSQRTGTIPSVPPFNTYESPPHQANDLIDFNSPLPQSSENPHSGFQVYESPSASEQENDVNDGYDIYNDVPLLNTGCENPQSVYILYDSSSGPENHPPAVYDGALSSRDDDLDEEDYGLPLHEIYAGDFACQSQVYQEDVEKLYDSLRLESLNRPVTMDTVVYLMDIVRKGHRSTRRRISHQLQKYHEELQERFLDYFLIMEAVNVRPGA